MKKLLTIIICVLCAVNVKAQALKDADFNQDNKGRPEVERIFKTADGTRSMIYYTDATVSFYNNSKYTVAYVVHNIAEPLSMMIIREDGQGNDMLYYSAAKSSYTDKKTGVEYILDKSSIRSMETSR
jgi:hypothetical protein